MQRKAYPAAGLLILILSGCIDLSAQEQMTFGKYALFRLKENSVVETDSLGVLLGRAKGTLNRISGGKEKARFESYSYDGDSIPDLYVIINTNDLVISVGLDTTSSYYLRIKQELKEVIKPDLKSFYENREVLLYNPMDSV